MIRTLAALACLGLFGAASPAAAGPFALRPPELSQRLSPDQAREEARAGRQLPLEALLPRIRAQVGEGHALATHLEARGSQRVYVLRWKSGARLMDLEVDAATGQVLEVR